jgi:hypothetical protein
MNDGDHQDTPDDKPRMGIAILMAVTPSLILLAWFMKPLWNWPREALPDVVAIDAVLTSDSSFGLREGCQSAVYRLSPSLADRLKSQGIAALSGDTHPRSENPDNRYGGWRETPGDIDFAHNGHGAKDTVFGLYASGGCAGNVRNPFSRTIDRALVKRGSYYTVTSNREGIIIVAPEPGLAAYYSFG